jgi:CBS domain-containing protein
MRQKRIPDLVVVDPSSQEVLGVVGDFDIVQNIVAENKNLENSKVRQAMYTIKPVDLNTTVSEAFKRMRDLHVNVVPVVDNGKFKGVVSIQDCWSYIPDERIDNVGLIR